ncbi:MAG TPA: sigma factor G inhibitor Gin [Bacillales bacterium]|nr:sigma factor G inhibitor Gin [Bacillales bacterium]
MEKTAVAWKTGETCLICEEKKEVGIHICDRFICDSCERKLVNTDTGDAHYAYYLKKLRNLCGDDHAEKS